MATSEQPSTPNGESLQRRETRLQTLNEISRVVSATLDLRTLYDTIYKQVGRVMDTSVFLIALQGPTHGALDIPYLREEESVYTQQEVPYGRSVTSLVMAEGTPLLFHSDEDYVAYAQERGLPEILIGEHDPESMIFVPMNTGSRTIGVLSVQSLRKNAYTEDDVQTLSVIASQAAIAIENARLYQHSQDNVRQMHALLHVAQMINGSLELQTVLDAILSGMRDVIPYYLATVLLPGKDGDCLEVVGGMGPPELRPMIEELRTASSIPLGHGITSTVFVTGEPIVISDVHDYPEHLSHGDFVIGSEMAVPLKRGDEVIGVLDIERQEVGGFLPEELDLLQLFASQAAIAIENARLYRQQEQRAEELAAIQSILQQLTPLHDTQAIAQVINEELKILIDYHTCRLFVLAPDNHTLVPVARADVDPVGLTIHLGEGITGWIAQHGQSVLVPNTLADPRGSQIEGTPVREESMVGAPMTYEGKVRGVVTLSKLGIDQFDHNALRLLEIIAGQTALALHRARLYDELHRQAMTDELTGLFNRRYLVQRACEEQARTRRSGQPLIALMIDIDGFKQVNDRFGHDAGDGVLRQLAGLLRGVVRGEDIVARYGGEEFCVLVPEIPLQDAAHLADRIRLVIAGHQFGDRAGVEQITVSVGLAAAEGDETVEDLFHHADQAMYAVKRMGGNRICLLDHHDFRFFDGQEVVPS